MSLGPMLGPQRTVLAESRRCELSMLFESLLEIRLKVQDTEILGEWCFWSMSILGLKLTLLLVSFIRPHPLDRMEIELEMN